MNNTKRILWAIAAAVGMAVAAAGPVLAGERLNHSEPLTKR